MKVSPVEPTKVITMKTTDKKSANQPLAWWKGTDKKKRGEELLTTAAFLKESQSQRYRAAAVYARLYGNMSLFNFAGSNMSQMDKNNGLPIDRPTFNLVQSCVDTLVSRISQSRPAPVFLTDNGDYRERNLSKKLNQFILGEFHHTKAYEKATIILRDCFVEGTGCLKVYEGPDKRVALDRVLLTELLVDPNEAIYGEPRQLYQIKLMDRSVLMDQCPEFKKEIGLAEQAYPDNSADSSKTVSDLVMVVEGWRLPSGPEAGDGRHTIACTSGTILDEAWEKDSFPFVFLHYSPRMLGFWAQGLAEQLMGTQIEINSLLYTISRAIKLVGVPRTFIQKGSKVVKAHFNNEVGSLIEYSGTKPIYEVAPCVPQEMYAQLQRLIEYGYQQCGVSALSASSQKPAGLNSGEAIRSYDDISTDRMAATHKRYDNMFVDLTYKILDVACDIAERDGKYSTVYPAKNGVREVDLPAAGKLRKNSYVVQVFTQSSLPKDPAGRLAKITEMMQAGIITLTEGRRLLDYPDLNQAEILANAAEERILQVLDDIIDRGKFSPPEPTMDLALGKKIVVQYINLYGGAKLEEEKLDMLRNWYTQIMAMEKQAMTPPPGAMPPAGDPMAVPAQRPTSDMLPVAAAPAA